VESFHALRTSIYAPKNCGRCFANQEISGQLAVLDHNNHVGREYRREAKNTICRALAGYIWFGLVYGKYDRLAWFTLNGFAQSDSKRDPCVVWCAFVKYKRTNSELALSLDEL
jgi:hypothetical protein